MATLCIAGLAKSFGATPVLSGVDLAVASGAIVALLGASGSGKTTLLRLVCGFEHADAGTIEIGGRIVAGAQTHVPPERREIGYVAQEGALFPHLSVADNITFGLPRRARRARHRVAELLDLVGLPPAFAERPPQALSGGEQQRVALARALAREPKLVLLDEPFSALDAGLRAETRAAAVAAFAATGATALLVTHDQAEALSIGHRVAVLRHGRLVQVADPATLYRAPHDADLARFVGEAVVLPGVIAGGWARCALGTLAVQPDTPDGAAEIMIRPEQIRLAAPAPGAVTARVCRSIFYGHDTSVHLALAGVGPAREIIARVPGDARIEPGAEVAVSVVGPVVGFAMPRAGAGSPPPDPPAAG